MNQFRGSPLHRIEVKVLQSPWAYSIMAGAALIDIYLLYGFFSNRKVPTQGDKLARENWLNCLERSLR